MRLPQNDWGMGRLSDSPAARGDVGRTCMCSGRKECTCVWLDGASRPQPPQMQPVLQHAALGGLQGHRRARHLRLLQPSPRNRLCQPHVAQPGLQAAWSHVHGLRDPWRPEEDAGGKRTERCGAKGQAAWLGPRGGQCVCQRFCSSCNRPAGPRFIPSPHGEPSCAQAHGGPCRG